MPKKTKPNYKKDLENAARQMVLIHRLDTLIKLILRTITKNLKVTHAGLLLYDKQKGKYIAKMSHGVEGLKIPAGFIKVAKNNPLIQYFNNPELHLDKKHLFLISNSVEKFLKSPPAKKDKKKREFFQRLEFQLSLYNTKVCIPGFFRNDLICVFLLGDKSNRRKFTSEELGFLSVLSSDVVMAIQNAWYFQDLKRELKKNKQLFLQTVRALTTAIEAKDRYTFGHTERVTKYSLAIAKQIKKAKRMPWEKWKVFRESVKIAAFLHDIGKIGIPKNVLNKKGRLNKKEWEMIKQHPLIGASILEKVKRFNEPILGVKYHHERFDGKGYPKGLKKNNIPLIAQVLSVADSFDAMTSNRPYRKALDASKAVNIINKNSSKQFSSLTVNAFLKAFKSGVIKTETTV